MAEKEAPAGVGSGLVLIMAIINVAIGASYQDDCNFAVPTYLMAAGGITLAFSGLWMFAMCTPCECDDKFAKFISPLVVFAQFCIVMWGTILVFGWYSSWTYDVKNNTNDEYCGYTPYMYSFVMLILGWCTLPFLLFCSCAALFCSKWENCGKDDIQSLLTRTKFKANFSSSWIFDINYAFKSIITFSSFKCVKS